ncbi:MAG: hypothetical protein H7Z42_02080, partial [Roseiflexaceae bacterium]|nr:hypothetical protein [Roseiflexaceae bacterium]
MPALPSLLAVERMPTLHQAHAAVAAQRRRVEERMARAVTRPELISEFDTLLGEIGSGLLLIEGPPGAGATTLLCQLAAERGYPLWLSGDDAGAGLAALCAQVIAIYDLPVPVVPPAASHDAQPLKDLLAEAVARRSTYDPLVVLVDTLPPDDTASPPFQPSIPAGVVIVYACEPGSLAPDAATARLRLPISGAVLMRSLVEAARALGASKSLATALAAHSDRSFLYVALAYGLFERGLLRASGLPEGLEALHAHWWRTLDDSGRTLAFALAGAGEPLPLDHAAALAQAEAPHLLQLLDGWGPLVERTADRVRLYHAASRGFILRQAGDVAAIHAGFVALARSLCGSALDQGVDDYFTRQLARHLALSEPPQGVAELASRTWALAQERRTGGLRQSAADAAWAATVASATGRLDQLVRAAVASGTLASLGRTLAPETTATAMLAALDNGEPRDAVLRRTRALIDQLPDGRAKALVLRRVGEACFERGIKTHAVRMLAEALDLEVPGLPRRWRDEREEAQATLARAALQARDPDRALGIAVRIAHPERRGLIETEVVRHLIAQHKLTRAEEVAQAIVHSQTHEWALAEVAAGHARAGHSRRFREVLGTLKTETASAWARTELACDLARHGDTAAVEHVAVIAHQRLRDEALGLVAQALVEGGQSASALMAARMVAERDVRARTLIDLALTKAPNAAAALTLAAEDIRGLGDDDRTPLTVLLASAYARVGDLPAAMHTVELLEQGEQRDRGHSRIAAALARAGEVDTAARIAATIPDADERGWTQHELANAYITNGRLDKAAAMVGGILDDEQRARALTDLCVARARAGRVAGALTAIEQIGLESERARALSTLAPVMVARGFGARADAARETIGDTAARSRYTVAL